MSRLLHTNHGLVIPVKTNQIMGLSVQPEGIMNDFISAYCFCEDPGLHYCIDVTLKINDATRYYINLSFPDIQMFYTFRT